MFSPDNRNTTVSNQLDFTSLHPKTLVYVLDYGESPKDLPRMLWQEAFKGESDVFISRAEIDLRKAVQSLSFSTDVNVNSFESLAALSLPGTTTALFWTIESLLKQKYQKPDLNNLIRHRNHDARLLFKRLAQLNLDPWYDSAVERISHATMPTELQFPPGHPKPGFMYRQHPLKAHQHCYYPVNAYFALLFEERKQMLLKMLEALGATKVVISSAHTKASDRLGDIQPERIDYTGHPQRPISAFEPSHYPWLAYEPSWQSVVDTRLIRRVPSISFAIDIDVMGMLRTQIHTTTQLISELTSMLVPDDYKETLAAELLHPMQVDVEFHSY